ncbi:MAG TPA: GNAT family N-acetyltransferase, partial [Clostridia bacterium]|nr:GNAT family N-acetyltransferase [Clostridia bacterium]
FDKYDRETFKELCYEFYQSNTIIRDYDESIANLTFDRVLDHHENLWGFFIMDKETDKTAGYALVTSYWCNEEGGDIIVLDELYIAPEHRNKGYGTSFMEWVEEFYRDKAVSITLEVLTTNINACHLYCKEGYVPDGYITYTKKL